MTNQTALEQAIYLVGGPAKLATGVQVRPNVVSNWLMRGNVPENHCPSIERLTGVRCERLRPDLLWTRNEAGEITGYHVRLSAA